MFLELKLGLDRDSAFRLLGWFSHYDKSIPREIPDRHRWSKKIWELFFDSELGSTQITMGGAPPPGQVQVRYQWGTSSSRP